MQNCKRFGTLGELQDGFRKGRSTTCTLLPSLISLLNPRNGCPKEAVKMHASTLETATYYLKSLYGVSQQGYSNKTGPVYGNEQGAGDSPSQWSQESAMLFQIFQ
jgi:hypothetical protein